MSSILSRSSKFASVQFIAYQVFHDLSLKFPLDVIQDLVLLLNQLHFFMSALVETVVRYHCVDRYLISIKDFFTSGCRKIFDLV